MATFIEALGAYLSPYWYIFAILMALFGIVVFFLLLERSDLKRYTAGDVFVRKRCYKEKKPLGRIVDKAGTESEFVVETNPEMPGTAVYKDLTLVAPNLISTNQRGRLKNGIQTLNYVLPYHFPTGFSNALAICQMLKFLRHPKNTDMFGWISDDFALVHLMFCTDKYLVTNCEDVISTYVNMGMEIPCEYLPEDEVEEPSEDEIEDVDQYSMYNVDSIEGDDE